MTAIEAAALLQDVRSLRADVDAALAKADAAIQRAEDFNAHLDEWFARSNYTELYSRRSQFWLNLMLVETDPDWHEVCRQNADLLTHRERHLIQVLL